MIIEIFIAVITIFILYQLKEFWDKQQKWLRVSDKFTPLGPRHPIWGALHLVTYNNERSEFSNSEEFLKLSTNVVQETRTKMFTYWIMFFYPMFGVCHPDTARVIFKSSAPKAKHHRGGIYRLMMPWIGDGLLISSGAKWERSRRLLTPAFHFDILKPYVSEYNQVTETLLANFEKSMEKEGCVEVYRPVSLATLDTMLRCSLSYESHIQDTGEDHPYVAAVNRLATLLLQRAIAPWNFFDAIYYLTPSGREFKRLCNFVHEFSDKIIAKRKDALARDPSLLKKRRLDFLDILLTAKDENGQGLSDIDIRAEVDTFMFEGHDTTASAISWAIYALGKYPEEQQIVFTEINQLIGNKDYLDWEGIHNANKLTYFLKEVMRMFSTVPFATRWLTEPLVFEGVEIPANCAVDINFHAMNHHPDVWPDHEEFRPQRFEEDSFHERDPFCYAPFSAGSRNCIGQHFALNEQRVMIARIVKRFKVHLVPGHEYVKVPDLVMRPKYGIKLRLEKR